MVVCINSTSVLQLLGIDFMRINILININKGNEVIIETHEIEG
jgi:hypothetical protein